MDTSTIDRETRQTRLDGVPVEADGVSYFHVGHEATRHPIVQRARLYAEARGQFCFGQNTVFDSLREFAVFGVRWCAHMPLAANQQLVA